MGARSSNTHRSGSRNNSQNRLLNGHNASFYNSNLNAGNIGPNPAPGTAELSGGTIITTPTHKYHSFTSSGNLLRFEEDFVASNSSVNFSKSEFFAFIIDFNAIFSSITSSIMSKKLENAF